MEKDHTDLLMKSRSVRGCITAGLKLYSNAFRRIVRLTWLPFTVYALLSGLLTSFLTVDYPEAISTYMAGKLPPEEAVVPLTTAVVGLLLVVTAIVTCVAFALGLLRQHSRDGFVCQPTTWHGLGLLAPFSSAVKAVKRFFKSFRDLFHHFGLMFAVTFIVVVFLVFALLFTTLPAIILAVASVSAHVGVLGGDPLAMPHYIKPLSIAAFSLAGLIQAYILLAAIIPVYYAYGSAITQEQERNEKKNSLYRP